MRSSYQHLKRLGWLSSYARQALLSRYLLRQTPVIYSEYLKDLNRADRAISLLSIFRLAISLGNDREFGKRYLDAPYSPHGRPGSFKIRTRKSEYAALEINGWQNSEDIHWTLGFPTRGFSNHEIPSVSLNTFWHEIQEIAQGITLFKKAEADLRVRKLYSTPLWKNAKYNNGTKLLVLALKKLSEETNSAFDFWADWYESILNGIEPNWELWNAIAAIDEEHWENGPEAVAEAIKEIQANLLAKRAALAEEMVFDQNQRTFKTIPIEIDTPDLFRVSLERSEFAYSLAISGNGLNATCYEAKILGHTFKTCRDDPQTVEMNFMQVAGSLKRQVECHEYPESPEINGLADTLFQAALDIRATHPAVKEARDKRAQTALHEATPEQKEALADALPVLKAISDDKLAEEFELDFGQVLNSSAVPVPNTAPKLPGADATHRIGNRVAKMSLLTKSSNIAKALDGSGGYKALTISLTLHTLVGIILRLLGG